MDQSSNPQPARYPLLLSKTHQDPLSLTLAEPPKTTTGWIPQDPWCTVPCAPSSHSSSSERPCEGCLWSQCPKEAAHRPPSFKDACGVQLPEIGVNPEICLATADGNMPLPSSTHLVVTASQERHLRPGKSSLLEVTPPYLVSTVQACAA